MLLSFRHCNYQITPSCNHRSYPRSHRLLTISLASRPRRSFQPPLLSSSPADISAAVSIVSKEEAEESDFELGGDGENENYNFDGSFELSDSKRFVSPAVEVRELDELPEQWRRSRLAWLCKELPAHRSGTFIRVLSAQRKWIRQPDCTYVAVHCMRIRENEAAFRVYKWMKQQHWFQFDFALASRLADYMGKERKYSKCREIFDDIVNQGLIPNESTFHILIVAYLSSSASNCIEEACTVYNQMIHLGAYKPRLSLHNSLFRSLVSKTGRSCKNHLEQAEFVFYNLTACRLKVHDDIYGGLIWLHSYQDAIDRDRIALLRAEMKSLGIKESTEVLVSVLRVCAKEGDLEEADRIWKKILFSSNNKPPILAFLYLMEVYSRIGSPMKSLEIFRKSREIYPPAVASYNKIIEIFCRARNMDLAESLMSEFIDNGLRPVMQSFIEIMLAYADSGSPDKVGSTFLWFLDKSRPNKTAYNLYLDSLVDSGDLDRAELTFNHMHADDAIGINARSCNAILRAYLSSNQYAKVKLMHDFMCEKKYVVETSLNEKLEHVMSLSQEEVEKSIPVLKLSIEQREILIGMILGGLKFKTDEDGKKRIYYAIDFVFREDSKIHSVLRRHVYNKFHEWLAREARASHLRDGIPYQFTTVTHSFFKFYADRFWPGKIPVIPNLINRWLTPRVLAYWYMYGGYRTSSGDILLRLRFGKEDVLRIHRVLKEKFLKCRVKKKGSVFWMGFLGEDAGAFWETTRSFVLADLKESLEPGIEPVNGSYGFKGVNLGSDSDSTDDDDSRDILS
ncbi:Pentatricopeptide repeat-containing protein [Striga hermonthica]|uniref:Pentatricopeptide repeat-containing protein n=1 Tax=Striga hermonthica TaxID=68872 RepID=A0A9N7R2R5_STRHE|nr:Pentatricopeptide repeat-containing protein [Striga hermonthica]